MLWSTRGKIIDYGVGKVSWERITRESIDRLLKKQTSISSLASRLFL